MMSTRISHSSSQSFTVQAYAQAAASAKVNGEMSRSDVLALVKTVNNSPEQLSKANFKEIQNHNSTMQGLVNSGKNATELSNALNLVGSRVVSAEAKAAQAEAQSTKGNSGIVTDQKTVHFSDTKALSRDFAKLTSAVNDMLGRLNDPSGWKRPKADEMQMMNRQIAAFSAKVENMQDNLASSSYKHHSDKAKTLDKLQTGAEKLMSETQAKFASGTAKNDFKAWQAETNRQFEQKHIDGRNESAHEFQMALKQNRTQDLWQGGMVK